MENQQKEEPIVFYLNKRQLLSLYRSNIIGISVGFVFSLLLFIPMAIFEGDWDFFWILLVCIVLMAAPLISFLGFLYGKASKTPTKITLFSDRVLFGNTIYYFSDIINVKIPNPKPVAIRVITIFHTGGKTSYILGGGRRDVNKTFPDYEKFYYSLITAIGNKRIF